MSVQDCGVGDVVVGAFSCLLPAKRREIRVRVTSRYTEGSRRGFLGEHLDRHPDEGYGAWGYDNEIREVEPAGVSGAD